MSVSDGGREEFVRPLGGRHSREGRVRARFRRMRIELKCFRGSDLGKRDSSLTSNTNDTNYMRR